MLRNRFKIGRPADCYPRAWLVAAVAVGSLLCGCSNHKAKVAQVPVDPPRPYHIHLPGIGGYRSIDRGMLLGLREGGLDAEIVPYDWTGADVGLSALLATRVHVAESARVAQLITDLARAHPTSHLTVSCHSGGAGILVWALEECPADVMLDDVLMLSPALSPGYDLSKALRHVRGHIYVVYSPYDEAVLGVGTRMFGTIDGVKTDAAGKVGFTKPQSADEHEYAKLVQVEYQSDWLQLGNMGDHIGSMSRAFARVVLAPLLLRGEIVKLPERDVLKVPAAPATSAVPATLPVSGAAPAR